MQLINFGELKDGNKFYLTKKDIKTNKDIIDEFSKTYVENLFVKTLPIYRDGMLIVNCCRINDGWLAALTNDSKVLMIDNFISRIDDAIPDEYKEIE